MKKSTELEIIIVILITLLFLSSFFFKDQIQEWITKEVSVYGVLFLFSLSFLLDFLPQYISPHLLIVQSKILGIPLTGISIIVIAGAIIGSFAGFEVGKRLGKRVVKTLAPEKSYKKIKQTARDHGKWFMMIAGISPLPYLPFVFGSLEIERKDFFYYGIIPRLIGLILFSLLLNRV